ncbi:MAG: DUF3048 domain-containing protein [Actinomycetota bacterium]|nr:DUF3048 domain-containing protein [Actinomycetota bacterium]
MTTRIQLAAAGVGIIVLAAAAFFLLSGRGEVIPGVPGIGAPPTCPLSGDEPRDEALLDRPAVAIKVENAAIAYPLSGLEKAEVVYEELVEGGVTRFMAIYHCSDSNKVGPVRSAREIDPTIMTPTARILGFSGANEPVLKALDEAEIVQVTESAAGDAMRRVPRAGLTSEHTLYASTPKIRKVGQKKFEDPPPGDSYESGKLPEGAKKAGSIEIVFSSATTIDYKFEGGRYLRSQNGAAFETETGGQLAVDNVLIEEHEIALSKKIVDVAGNPSVVIADQTGSGRAVLFRDGRVVVGRWSRESVETPVTFETEQGDKMLFSPGSTWVHLVPSDKGEVKGSFDYEK